MASRFGTPSSNFRAASALAPLVDLGHVLPVDMVVTPDHHRRILCFRDRPGMGLSGLVAGELADLELFAVRP
jgi:hypothetical protein